MNNENIYVVARDGILDCLEISVNLVTSFLVERGATANQLATHPICGEFSFPVLDNVPVINRYYERYLELRCGRFVKADKTSDPADLDAEAIKFSVLDRTDEFEAFKLIQSNFKNNVVGIPFCEGADKAAFSNRVSQSGWWVILVPHGPLPMSGSSLALGFQDTWADQVSLIGMTRTSDSSNEVSLSVIHEGLKPDGSSFPVMDFFKMPNTIVNINSLLPRLTFCESDRALSTLFSAKRKASIGFKNIAGAIFNKYEGFDANASSNRAMNALRLKGFTHNALNSDVKQNDLNSDSSSSSANSVTRRKLAAISPHFSAQFKNLYQQSSDDDSLPMVLDNLASAISEKIKHKNVLGCCWPHDLTKRAITFSLGMTKPNDKFSITASSLQKDAAAILRVLADNPSVAVNNTKEAIDTIGLVYNIIFSRDIADSWADAIQVVYQSQYNQLVTSIPDFATDKIKRLDIVLLFLIRSFCSAIANEKACSEVDLVIRLNLFDFDLSNPIVLDLWKTDLGPSQGKRGFQVSGTETGNKAQKMGSSSNILKEGSKGSDAGGNEAIVSGSVPRDICKKTWLDRIKNWSCGNTCKSPSTCSFKHEPSYFEACGINKSNAKALFDKTFPRGGSGRGKK